MFFYFSMTRKLTSEFVDHRLQTGDVLISLTMRGIHSDEELEAHAVIDCGVDIEFKRHLIPIYEDLRHVFRRGERDNGGVEVAGIIFDVDDHSGVVLFVDVHLPRNHKGS